MRPPTREGRGRLGGTVAASRRVCRDAALRCRSIRAPTYRGPVDRRLLYPFKATDAFDWWFGMFPAAMEWAAFLAWGNLIVRAIRGEDVKEDWRTYLSAAGLMASRTLIRGAQARTASRLDAAATQMRELVREAAAAAEARDRRSAEREEQQYRLNRLLFSVAVLTLVVAAAAIVVTLAK